MKLNLGGWNDGEYTGVDKDGKFSNPDKEDKYATHILDLEEDTLFRLFDMDTIDEIKTTHFLEHLSLKSVCRILKESYDILKEGGKILIMVPNALATKEDLTDEYGDNNDYPISKHVNYDHKLLFTKPLLKRMLEEVGFKDIGDIKNYTQDLLEKRPKRCVCLEGKK